MIPMLFCQPIQIQPYRFRGITVADIQGFFDKRILAHKIHFRKAGSALNV